MNAESKTPIRIDGDEINTTKLEPFVPWPEAIRAEAGKHAVKELFGGEFSVYLYESEPGLLKFNDYPFDEFVQVLSGSAVLTDAAGNSQTFNAGDRFIMPKGFSGTWELQGEYRELFIMETNSMNAGFEKLGIGG
ncbi:MAG: DUF861 domain-containing protein [Gammaproteobacteria bacterium]|jgi:uncharacterized cupin superfamily protein|nr:DUF861 domain-containing protein [Gammaproteobacteria bacterium]